LVSSLTLQQGLKPNPVLFKAADFNEGFLLPVLSSFTGFDMTTILPKPKLVEKKNLQVQVASLPCH